MDKEIKKAMNRKNNVFHRLAKWYWKNGYKISRAILFPVWIAIIIKNKVRTYFYSQTEWSEEKAHEILNYYIPRNARWEEDNEAFYFIDNGSGWQMPCNKRKIKLKDRLFWNKFTSAWGGEIRKYLIEKFELGGFIKEVGDTDMFWTDLTFILERN